MANKSRQELREEFKRDYSSAISFYNDNDLIHFNRDIRPAIESFGRLLILEIVGEQGYRKLEDNSEYIDALGNFVPQNPGYTVEGSGWVKNAKGALMTNDTYQSRDRQHSNLKKKIDSGLDQLIAQYSEVSETSEHTGAAIDEERMRYQSDLCIATFPALFNSLSKYISPEFVSYLKELPKAEDSTVDGISRSSYILEKENALLALDELTQGFKRQGGAKFVAILPEDASTVIGKSRLSEFFKIKWSLVIDFNPDDESAGTLYSSAPSSSMHVVTTESGVTDGSELINWMFAKGRNSLQVYSETSLHRDFPKMFKQTLSQMVRAGSSDNYVIVSFCGNKDANALTLAFSKLDDIFGDWDSVENRCSIACLSNSLDFSEKLTRWKEESCLKGLKLFLVQADLKDFINHISFTIPLTSLDSADERCWIRGRSLDVTDDVKKYKEAGIEFFGPQMVSSTSNDLWDFYSGAEITWQELENDCDAKRNTYTKIKSSIFDIIRNNRNNVRVFTLKHRPCSGGSTLARRLAYDVYKEDEADSISCPVIQIKNYRKKDTVHYLSNLSEKLGNSCILAIVESKNVCRNDFDNIVNYLARAKKRIVFFYLETRSGSFRDSNKMDVAFLNDVLQGDEGKFILKYKDKGLSETSIQDAKAERQNQSLEVIDFPLLLKEDISSDSLSNYVAEWMENLPDNLKDFMGYVGFVSHYSQKGLNQNLVKQTWHNFAEQHYTLEGYGGDVMSAICKLLIEEDKRRGIWRPRYNQFAVHLIKSAWGNNWQGRLPELSKKFIQLCSKCGELGDDDKDMLYSLFIIRRDVNFRAEEVGRKNKFSVLINDLISNFEDSDRAASIFNTLVETFPDDPIFHGHYARFLYEKASSLSSNVKHNDKLFKDAQRQLDIAFKIQSADSDLFHMQGVLVRRRLASLRKEFESEQNKSAEYIDEINDKLTEWVDEALEAFNMSIKYDPSSPYGYAASCQLLKEAIEFEKIIFGAEDYSFCERDSKYTGYVDKLGERLDQFEQVCNAFRENALPQIRSAFGIYHKIRLFHRDIIGEGAGSVMKYRDLYSSSSGEMRGFYGNFLVMSILYSKTNTKDLKAAYGCLREDEYKEIEMVLQRKRDEGDLKCYDGLFKLYRYGKKEYSLDSAIDLLRECEVQYQNSNQMGWGYLNACYYLAVCYSAMAIQGDELNSELVHQATRYFNEATKLAEVFGKSTINSICYFGEKKDLHCVVDKESEGVMVSGIIMDIDEKNKGTMRMKCGLEASFNANGMDKYTYQGRPIQGIIGFKYSGLGLYQFGKTDIIDASEEEIEEIINNSYVPDFYNKEEGVEVPVVESTGPKILGKIELPETKPRNVTISRNQTYSGTYDRVTNSVSCSVRRYPIKVRTKTDNDLYDGADVLFEIDSEPNSKNPDKPYYIAKNVRFKN